MFPGDGSDGAGTWLLRVPDSLQVTLERSASTGGSIDSDPRLPGAKGPAVPETSPHPQITIIGGGTPTPLAESFGSAYVIDIGGEKLLFDCGPATTFKLAKAGISPTEIDSLFITHHHFDHDADLPAFLLTRWDGLVPSDRPLDAYGPPHTRTLIDGLINPETGLWAGDLAARMNRPGSRRKYEDNGGTLPRRPPVVDVATMDPGSKVTSANWRVTAALAEHAQPYLDALAYRVDSDLGSVVITGDTQPCASVTNLARGADVLMMMCWESEEKMAGTPHATGATSITGAAKTAAEAGVRQLVMVHVGARLMRPEMAAAREAEARKVWDGPLVWAKELETIPPPP